MISLEGYLMNEFNTVYNRNNTKSLKWDNVQAIFQTDDVLPMWVADMDFKAPEAVNQALIERAEHGIYGYTIIGDDIRTNVSQWIKKRHQWDVANNELIFSPGVITSLHTAIHSFTDPNDKILLQTPVYTPFFQLIENNNRQVVENRLHYNGSTYEIDFVDLEAKLQDGVKAFMLCSTHNPVGRDRKSVVQGNHGVPATRPTLATNLTPRTNH